MVFLKQKKSNTYRKSPGVVIELVLVFGAVFLVIGVSLMSWIISQQKLITKKVNKELALQIAEAGIDYYSWHLAHDENDYKDSHDSDSLNGNGNYGPYIHVYYNNSGQEIGEYSLEITPPAVGSTIATINSTGYTRESPSVKRTLKVRVGKRSFADYSFLTDAPIWLGDGEATTGKTHSNNGIRFDDTAHAKITSGVATYDCAGTGHACTGIKPGIWGSGGPTSFWEFPVIPIDFSGVTVDLSVLKSEAQDNGVHYNPAAQGYHITFKNDGSFDVRRVSQLENTVRQWIEEEPNLGAPNYRWRNIPEQIKTETLVANHAIPTNGIVFIEDNVWVDGVVNGKVTLVAAKLPDTGWDNNKDIRINGNITYVARDGNHKLGLLAQRNILVPRYAPSNLVIDGAMLAQKGHVYYRNYASRSSKTNIEVYGSVITNKFWTWSWLEGAGIFDGYATTNTIYDNTLAFYPPPFFPTTGSLIRLSWEED